MAGSCKLTAQCIIEMAKGGVTNLYLMTLQTFVGPEQDILACRDVVFPRLQAEGYL